MNHTTAHVLADRYRELYSDTQVRRCSRRCSRTWQHVIKHKTMDPLGHRTPSYRAEQRYQEFGWRSCGRL
jgi:hypothetical protein